MEKINLTIDAAMIERNSALADRQVGDTISVSQEVVDLINNGEYSVEKADELAAKEDEEAGADENFADETVEETDDADDASDDDESEEGAQ